MPHKKCPADLGAIQELIACTFLMENGFTVFRNVSPAGKADLVAWKPGEVPILIDVTTGHGLNKDGSKKPYANYPKISFAKENNIRILTVFDGECSWHENQKSKECIICKVIIITTKNPRFCSTKCRLLHFSRKRNVIKGNRCITSERD